MPDQASLVSDRSQVTIFGYQAQVQPSQLKLPLTLPFRSLPACASCCGRKASVSSDLAEWVQKWPSISFQNDSPKTSDSRFVVCDVISSSASSFRERFLAQFPGANMTIAATPEECVFLVYSAACYVFIQLSGLFWPHRLS